MGNWEYRTQRFEWDQTRQDWIRQLKDGSTLVGLSQVIDHYDDRGWKLVSLHPHAGVGRVRRHIRATFKRSTQPA